MTVAELSDAALRAARHGLDPFTELDRIREAGTRVSTADWLGLVAAAHDVRRAEMQFQATVARVTRRT